MHSTTRLSSLTCRLMLRNSTPWSTCGVTGSTMNCPMSVRKTCGNSAKALAAHCDECAAGRVSSPLSGNSPHWPLTELYYAGFSNGRITSITDPAGRVVPYPYAAAGNLSVFQDAAGGLTQYAYDAGPRLTAGTDVRGIT